MGSAGGPTPQECSLSRPVLPSEREEVCRARPRLSLGSAFGQDPGHVPAHG